MVVYVLLFQSKQYLYNFTEVVEKKSQDSEVHPALLVFTITAFPIGSLLGSLLFAPLADKCGRYCYCGG